MLDTTKTQCVSVLVPDPYHSTSEWEEVILPKCTRIAGGFTSYEFTGGWVNPDTGKIEYDTGVRYDFFIDSPRSAAAAIELMTLITEPATFLLGLGESSVAFIFNSDGGTDNFGMMLVDDEALRIIRNSIAQGAA